MGGGLAATWCFPCGLMLNSAWPEAQPGEQSGLVSRVVAQCPFRLNIRMASLCFLYRERRIVIPKEQIPESLKDFGSVHGLLNSASSLFYPASLVCLIPVEATREVVMSHLTVLYTKNPLGLTEGISCLGVAKFGTMHGK